MPPVECSDERDLNLAAMSAEIENNRRYLMTSQGPCGEPAHKRRRIFARRGLEVNGWSGPNQG